jgi:proteasome accessory factor B
VPTETSRSAPEERLVNLVVALMATEQGLTKDTILSSVAGYREQGSAGASKDALEKMFERDKENLRSLGIPVETIGDYADPDDLREARYRIPTAEYELPADIEFTPAELAVLNRRRRVERELHVGRRAQRPAQDPGAGHRRRRADHRLLAARESARACLRADAARDRTGRVVEFSYLKAGENARVRRVQPYALIEYEARWHVYGFDLIQGDVRTFLLSRIVSDVAITRTTFDLALREGAGERALTGLAELAARQQALLEIAPAPRPLCDSRAGRRPPTRGSACPTSTSTSSPTSWPRTARRCAWSNRANCAIR